MSHHRKDKCQVSGKRRFRDKREAVDALHHAVNARKVATEFNLPSRRHEIRTYACSACRGWHLTSMQAYQLAA